MKLEEMSFAIENMFHGIMGGTDYLLQASVDPNTGESLDDAEIIMWNLPIERPTVESLEDFFSLIKEEFNKNFTIISKSTLGGLGPFVDMFKESLINFDESFKQNLLGNLEKFRNIGYVVKKQFFVNFFFFWIFCLFLNLFVV